MPQITIELPEDLDKNIQYYLVDNGLKNKKEAVVKALYEFFEDRWKKIAKGKIKHK